MLTRRVWMGIALAGCGGAVSCAKSPKPDEAMSESGNNPETAHAAPRFDPKALKQSLDEGAEVFLLDVRRPEELEQIGTIKGYHHIPMDQLETRMSEIPKGRPLVVF